MALPTLEKYKIAQNNEENLSWSVFSNNIYPSHNLILDFSFLLCPFNTFASVLKFEAVLQLLYYIYGR